MANQPQQKYGTQVQHRLENRLAEIIRRAVQDSSPVESSRHEQVWEAEVFYHGEWYGMDMFIDSVLADQSRASAIFRSVLGETGGEFTLEAVKKDQDSPPKILIRIHRWKKTQK